MNQVKNCPKARIVFKVFERLEKVIEKVMEFEEIKIVRTLYMFFSIIPVAKMETIAK